MAPKQAAENAKSINKMALLPKSAKVTKRPLMRPEIPSPYKGREAQKVVYVSSRTPFMSAFKRVKNLLKLVDKRAMQSELALAKQRGKSGSTPGPKTDGDDSPAGEEIVIKATGRAIDKALSLAVFLQKQSDLKVVIRTSTTQSIDDIEIATDGDGMEGADDENNSAADELPETRLRGVSELEIGVTLR